MAKIAVSKQLFKHYSAWIIANNLTDNEAEVWTDEEVNQTPGYRPRKVTCLSGMDAIRSNGSRYHRVGSILLTTYLVAMKGRVQNGYTHSTFYGSHMCLKEV